ncbi:hypothetical protein ONA00_00075 [Mycoplasmopsis cynos]|nr:hypothetical protein [Mycoplasmopsis cynos]WAM11543.1 hypothetical protein ONA00_00075 [Mycoplasmopsis cynos]
MNDPNLKKLNPSQYFIKILHEELVNILGGKSNELKVDKRPYVIMMCGLQGSEKLPQQLK